MTGNIDDAPRYRERHAWIHIEIVEALPVGFGAFHTIVNIAGRRQSCARRFARHSERCPRFGGHLAYDPAECQISDDTGRWLRLARTQELDHQL